MYSEGPFTAASGFDIKNILNDLIFRHTVRQLVKCKLDFRVPLHGNESEYNQNQGCVRDVTCIQLNLFGSWFLWVHSGELSHSDIFVVSVDPHTYPEGHEQPLAAVCNLTQIHFVSGRL